MTMQISFKNAPQFLAEIKAQLESTYNIDIKRRLAEEVVSIIRNRTRKERVDIHGNAFHQYSTTKLYMSTSAAYNANRAAPKGGKLSKSGKSMRFDNGYLQYKSIISGPQPNLDNLGIMLNSIDIKSGSQNNTLIIYFKDSGNRSLANSALGAVHQYGLGKNPPRPFFGIELPSELLRIQQLWEKLAKAKMESKR